MYGRKRRSQARAPLAVPPSRTVVSAPVATTAAPEQRQGAGRAVQCYFKFRGGGWVGGGGARCVPSVWGAPSARARRRGAPSRARARCRPLWHCGIVARACRCTHAHASLARPSPSARVRRVAESPVSQYIATCTAYIEICTWTIQLYYARSSLHGLSLSLLHQPILCRSSSSSMDSDT